MILLLSENTSEDVAVEHLLSTATVFPDVLLASVTKSSSTLRGDSGVKAGFFWDQLKTFYAQVIKVDEGTFWERSRSLFAVRASPGTWL